MSDLDMAAEIARLQGLLIAEQAYYRSQAAECIHEKHRADQAEADRNKWRDRAVSYELSVQRGIGERGGVQYATTLDEVLALRSENEGLRAEIDRLKRLYPGEEIERLRRELENANTQRERTLDECERMAEEIEKLKQGY